MIIASRHAEKVNLTDIVDKHTELKYDFSRSISGKLQAGPREKFSKSFCPIHSATIREKGTRNKTTKPVKREN